MAISSFIDEPPRRTPVRAETQVLVIGGGASGCFAAMGAASRGARVVMWEKAATLTSGAMPYGAAVTPDASRVLVTNQQAGTVSVLSAAGDAPRSIKVGGYPEGVVVSTDGSRAFVANWFSDDVSVLDLQNGSEIRRVKCPGGPRGIAVAASRP